MPIPLYSIKNLHIKIGKEEQLQINQFDIHRGACYVLAGPMGSGKTTFLDTLYSRRKIEKSKIRFEEKDIHKYSDGTYQDQIAVVPQKFSPPWGSVENYICKTIRRYPQIKNQSKRLNEIVHKMNISNLLTRKIKNLTPGEMRWVVIAAQIAADTKVLFIDEYEQHLGKEDIKTLNNVLYRKIHFDGITLITSTQDKDHLSRLASVIITLNKGRITSLRSFSKKKDNYRNKRRK